MLKVINDNSGEVWDKRPAIQLTNKASTLSVLFSGGQMMAYSTFWVLFILKEMQSVKSVGMMSKIIKLSKTLSLSCKDEVF